jgi:hypothetical protein
VEALKHLKGIDATVELCKQLCDAKNDSRHDEDPKGRARLYDLIVTAHQAFYSEQALRERTAPFAPEARLFAPEPRFGVHGRPTGLIETRWYSTAPEFSLGSGIVPMLGRIDATRRVPGDMVPDGSTPYVGVLSLSRESGSRPVLSATRSSRWVCLGTAPRPRWRYTELVAERLSELRRLSVADGATDLVDLQARG